jgi:putative membrane protein
MLEVELGRLAEKNGSMAEVKSFGKMMAEHHSKMLNDIRALAASKNITLPESMGDNNRQKMEKFSGKAGKEFDKDYVDAMEDGHEKTLKNLEDKTQDEKGDADVKALAAQAIPVVKSHLDEIKRIEEKMDNRKM